MVSKPVGCLNDELAEDDKTCEIEECGRWITKDSLRIAKFFGQPEATSNQGQPCTIGYAGQRLNILP